MFNFLNENRNYPKGSMRTLFVLLVVTALFNCQLKSIKHVEGLPYDTIFLKGGHQIAYYSNHDPYIIGGQDEGYSLRLTGPDIDTVIKEGSGMDMAVRYDLDDCVILESVRRWKPIIKVIKKKNGEEIAFGVGMYLDSTYHKFYYVARPDINNLKELDMIIKLDLTTLQKELIEPPEMPCSPWWECLSNIELTANEIVMTFTDSLAVNQVKKIARQ